MMVRAAQKVNYSHCERCFLIIVRIGGSSNRTLVIVMIVVGIPLGIILLVLVGFFSFHCYLIAT